MAIHEKATVELQVNGEQARKEMQLMEQHALSLKARIVEAQNAGDTKKVKQLQKDLKETNIALRAMRDNARNIDAAMNNIGLATPKELRRLLKDIDAKLNSGHIARGSEEWKKYQAQLKLVNAEIRKVNDEIKETEGWLTRFNNRFAKWGALAASGIAAITGISMTLNKMRKDRDDKEASAANLKALTGLDDVSIQWLARQAEILSTSMHKSGLRVTQSSKEILEAYMLVGSAKPDLLGNKEALNAVTIEAMRLSKAAKMDLKEAVDAVTLSMNQYGASADQAAVYTNVMAAGSKYGSAAVQSITSAVVKAGVSASAAGVPIEQLVGSIETLAEKGIKDEVAGTGLKMFFLRLQTGADETNPKIVGLQTALQNLQKLSVDEVVKRFGAETYTVAQTLIDGADKVEYYTKAVTGTNVAMEQAAINSETNEARMAQLKNQLRETGIELMERLNPSLNMLTGWTTKLIKVAPSVIDFIKKYGRLLIYAGSVLASYIVAMKLQWFWTNKVKTETGQYVLVLKLKQFWDKAVAASTWLQVSAKAALAGRTTLATNAFVRFFNILKLHPLGAFLTVVTALSYGIYKLATKTTESDKAVRDFMKSNIKEQTELNKLYAELKKTNEGTGERLRLVKEFNSKYGGYLSNLLSEKSTVLEIAAAYREVSSAISEKIAQEMIDNKRTEILEKSTEDRASALADFQKVLAGSLSGSTADMIRSQTMGFVDDMIAAGKDVDTVTTSIVQSIHRQYKQIGTGDLSEAKEALRDYVKAVKSDADKIESVQKRLGSLVRTPKKKPANELDEVVVTPSVVVNGGGSAENAKDKKEYIEKELLAIEEKYALEREKLQNEFLSKRNMTQEEYEQFGCDLEEQYLNKKLKVLGLEEKKRLEIQNKIMTLRDKFEKECSAKNQKEYNERQKSLESGLEQQLDTYKHGLQEQLYAGEINQNEQKELYRNYLSGLYDEIINNPLVSDEFKKKMSVALSDAQLDEQKESYEKAVNNLNKLKSQYIEIGQSFGQAMADFFTGEEKSLKDFLAKMLVTVLDALEKQLIAEQAAAIGLVTIKDITTKGLAGVATAAAKIALITAAFETAKGVLGGFSSGGFTGPGEWDRPQGIVHSNEFVANRFAVANPAIRPVLNLIDHAQRTNTVGSLTASDVSAVVAPSAVVPVSGSGNDTDPALRLLIADCVRVIQKVDTRLQQRIRADVYVAGPHGIDENLKKYNELKNNISR